MSLQFPSAPGSSVKRLWFKGRFVAAERSEGPFQIGIDLDVYGNAPPVGYVIGDDEVAKRLRFPPTGVRIVSSDHETPVSVDGVHLGTVYTKAGVPGELSRLVATFKATQVNVREQPWGSRDLRAVFLLNGPRRFWPAWRDTNGEIRDSSFPLLGFVITAEPVKPFVSSEALRNDGDETVMRVTVRPAEAVSFPDEATFSSIATETVEDLLTAMSFVHDGRIHWHERWIHLGDIDDRTNRNYVMKREGEPSWPEDPIVGREQLYSFLRTAVESLRQWRDDGHPLELPIAYRLNGGSRRGTITQSFTSLFLSLESLKTIHAVRQNLDHIVPRAHFRMAVKSALRGALAKVQDLDDHQRVLIDAKLGDLNRPQFRDVLRQMAADHRVEWVDLYPKGPAPDGVADFVAVRNRLFHGAAAVSEHRILTESERLKVFLDRLLLRMLGWEDISHVWPIHMELLRNRWTMAPP